MIDNIQTLDSDFDTASRFVLTCEVYDHDSSEEWTVVLRRPREGSSRGYCKYYEHGKGETPEAAYKDLLKNTAFELHDRGYSWNW